MRGPCTAMQSGPHLLQLGKALAQKRRPNKAINKFKKKTPHKFQNQKLALKKLIQLIKASTFFSVCAICKIVLQWNTHAQIWQE